jgi:hypothetical protein
MEECFFEKSPKQGHHAHKTGLQISSIGRSSYYKVQAKEKQREKKNGEEKWKGSKIPHNWPVTKFPLTTAL